MNLLRISFLTGASLLAVAGTLVWRGGRSKNPEQREALRRQRIHAQGRITDGCVQEMQFSETEDGRPTQLVLYSYGVSGVHYECAQDVTPLGLALDADSSCVGEAVNIKYDPHNPGDSIVAAEGWCGLRLTAPHPNGAKRE
jgi:Protein of unknown function (DUF3592)